MVLSNFRFSPTRPPVHWSGIRTAFAHGPVCPQSLPPEAVESEAAALKKVWCDSCDHSDRSEQNIHTCSLSLRCPKPNHIMTVIENVQHLRIGSRNLSKNMYYFSSNRLRRRDCDSWSGWQRRCRWRSNPRIAYTSTSSCQSSKVGNKPIRWKFTITAPWIFGLLG